MKAKLYLYTVLLITVMLCFAGCSKTDGKGVFEGEVEAAGDNETDNTGEKDTIDNNGEGAISVELPGENEIAFSQTGYFYSDSIKLEILSSRPCKIYYTTDGTNPDKDKKLYKKAIKLDAGSRLVMSCIKAKGYYEDGTESETIVHSYFLGKDVNKRFDNLVFSVTTDPYNLFDDVYGIFVEGKLRRDYIKDNPGVQVDPDDPANFNMRGKESEREVFLEILEPDGTNIAEQAAGIRTYGGWSRANNQKSIKIFARKEYDETNNKLSYEFFPSKTGADGKVIDTFKQLVLRNSGNDNGFAFIRDELFQTLAMQAGYSDYEAVRPITLFVNGDYRGLFWLHEVYCEEYFEDNYGKYTGSFEILEGGELYKKPDAESENAKVIEDYEAMYTNYSNMDLTEDMNYNKLCELIDVENYLSYYAFQIYIGNEDWPHNNYRTSRYYATEGEEYREAPFDGKWRYLLHDTDFSFGIYGTGALADNIGLYVGSNGEIRDVCPLFGQLMKRADCKEIFIKKTVDLINGAFASDNINTVLEEMNASRMNEQMNMYNKNLIADWVQQDQLEARLQDIRTYGSQRADHILTKYQEYFGLGDIYQLSVQPAKDCEIQINSFKTKDYFAGSYYSDYATVISTILPKGEKLDYWLVNGEKVYDETLTITPAEITGGKAEVTCVIK